MGVVEKNVHHASYLSSVRPIFPGHPTSRSSTIITYSLLPLPPFLSGQHPPPFVLLVSHYPTCPISLLSAQHPSLICPILLSASLFTVLSHLSHLSSVRPAPIPPLSYPSPVSLSSLFCPISLLSGQHPPSFVLHLSCQPLSLFSPTLFSAPSFIPTFTT